MSNTNTFFWILSSEDQAKLMMYQWDNYGTELEIAREKQPETYKTIVISETEDTEEIEKIMRRAPSKSRGKEIDE